MNDAELQTASPTPAAEGTRNKVVIRGLDFFYGESKALKDVTLSLRVGKVTAFIGPSGCG